VPAIALHMSSAVKASAALLGKGTPNDISDSEAASGKSSTSSGVTLLVTPKLAVPEERLPSRPLDEHLVGLATKDAPGKGLVDVGGQMPANGHPPIITGGHYNGFISAIITAFAKHYPLALRPQHFWLCICQAVSKHVELNAEAVRGKWVAHTGKKELVVRRDHFVMGARNDWASVIAAPDGFAAQIKENTVEGVVEAIDLPFSSSTSSEQIALQITLMDMTKSFFSFKCMTCCGFPSVTLEGSADDWRLLLTKAEKLIRERCEKQWGEAWLRALVPLLEKIQSEYATGAQHGAGDESFWNSMCKRGGTSGSGARTWFNGWINILYPYIQDAPNRYMVPYSPTAEYVKEGRDGGSYGMGAPAGVQGPDCADFPTGVAAAPVTWSYHGEEHKLLFKAGFIGATQCLASGTVRPAVGWYIPNDAGPQSVMEQDPFMASIGAGRVKPTGAPPRKGFVTRSAFSPR